MNIFPPPSPNLMQTQATTAQDNSSAPRAITSEMLLAGSRELVIKHAGRDYHLRLTRQGKLILTA
jgi:hemin uptake protein HemP